MLRSLVVCALAGLAMLVPASAARAQVRVVGPRFRPVGPRVIVLAGPRVAARVRVAPAIVSPGLVGPAFVRPVVVVPAARVSVVGGFVVFP